MKKQGYLFLWVLFGVIAILLASEFYSSQVKTGSSKYMQETVNDNSTIYTLPTLGDGSRILLSFVVNKLTTFSYGDSSFILQSGANNFGRCADQKNQLNCQLVLITGSAHFFKIMTLNQTRMVIGKIQYSVLSKNNQLHYYSAFVYIALIGLCVLVIFNFFVKKDSVTQWVIILFSLSLLALLEPAYALVVLIFLISFYGAGRCIARLERTSKNRRIIFLLVFVFSLLLVAKYGHNAIFSMFSLYQDDYVLPLGISYFVIRMIDTLLRWYRGELLNYNLREFLFFVLFPGTLMAGPIETLDRFYLDRNPRPNQADFSYGMARIILGVFKKVVLANGIFYPRVFQYYDVVATSPLGADHWITIYFLFANLLYAYFDFSGYSDIAIGYSRLFGFKIVENFDYPIFANNLQEFWRRWHRSLSMWAFRNVYFPLILKLRSPYFPALLTMLFIGLWHNLGLSWMTWGLYQGAGLCFLTWLETRRINIYVINMKKNFYLKSLKKGVGIAFTLSYVALSHSFVLFENYTVAWKTFLNALF